VPASRQRLIFRGKVLTDDKDLKFYGIADGMAVHLIVRDANAPAPAAAPAAGAAAAADDPNRPPRPQNEPERLIDGGADDFGMGMGMGAPHVHAAPIDLNQIVSGMLQGLGLGGGAMPMPMPGAAAAPAAGAAAPNANANAGGGGGGVGGPNGPLLPGVIPPNCDDVRSLFNAAANSYQSASGLSPGTSLPHHCTGPLSTVRCADVLIVAVSCAEARGVSATPLANDLNGLTRLLAQSNALMGRAQSGAAALQSRLADAKQSAAPSPNAPAPAPDIDRKAIQAEARTSCVA
jgi:hypothetical protein